MARSFLQSAVVFDDRATLEPPRLKDRDEDALPGDDQGSASDAERSGGHEPAALAEPPPATEPTDEGEVGVDADALGESFAAEGLVCGFLKPAPESADAEANLLSAGRRADIVILDWWIHRDGGAAARRIVQEMLQMDEADQLRRLRLVAIYTSRPEIATILRAFAEVLQDFYDDAPLEETAFSVTKGPVRIVLFAKPGSRVEGTPAADRIVEEAELPRRLIAEFAELTTGIVPNVALAGLAAVRSETHRILLLLSRELDPAYVGQRLLLEEAAEAEEQLVELLASEMRSVIEDRDVGREADADAVESWLRWLIDVNPAVQLANGVDEHQVEADLAALLEFGLKSDDEAMNALRNRREVSKSKAHLKATRLFTDSDQSADKANDAFAMRLSLRTHYSRPPRVLQLGTVVKDDHGQYLLCVQPVCDSVRLDPPERSFPFLPLSDDSDQFDFVFHDIDDGRFVRAKLKQKPHLLELITFRQTDETRYVLAEFADGRYRFQDTDGSGYLWVARLKDDYGQRVAHRLGSDFGRVGLSESEWLRLSGGGQD